MAREMTRLSTSTLALAGKDVRRPTYDRQALKPGVVHLGLGAFVRAHQALYTEDVLALQPGAWGIVGVSLQRPDQRDRLLPQDCLYTALRRDPAGVSARIVGCVQSCLVAPEDPAAVIDAMAAPDTKIVSLTVTEKGYCLDPATGRLKEHHPDIQHDLEHPSEPRSAAGFLLAALERRRDAGLSPFTVLCCDNLPSNGRLVESLVKDFAALKDCGLATWVDTHVRFPSTMVDRIVPATTADDIDEAARLTGLFDTAPVVHEPFGQWVVEDSFVDGDRPNWDLAGAEFVSDVAPYEHMKLRLLNGAHSALAYLGYLAGHQTIGEAVADPVLRDFVKGLWQDEIIPVVPPPPRTDLHVYTEALLTRFSNPAIRHRTWQIAMDGSQKLPQRLLETVRERLSRDLPIPRLALAVAAWVRYVGGVDEQGREIDVRDPLATQLRTRLDDAGDEPEARIRAVLGMQEIFGSDLPGDPRFLHALVGAYRNLLMRGARSAAAAVAMGS
jgi:fructuronate reductase